MERFESSALNLPRSFCKSAPAKQLWLSGMLFLLLGGASVFALNPAKSVSQYNCRSWGRQNGLQANAVLALGQASDGYLWLGTPRGLVRFDGSEFKFFDVMRAPGARSTIVTSIAMAREGGFWFGMDRGAFGFCDGRTLKMLGRDEWGGKSMLVQSLLATRTEDLWIGSDGQAARLRQGGSFEFVLTNSVADSHYNVTAICEDSQGRIWLGTIQQGLLSWKNGTLTKFPDPALDHLSIRSLAQDKAGRLWVGTQVGLRCYDAQGRLLPLPWPWWETRALLVDREGAVWAGTSGGGLFRFCNGTTAQFQKSDGLVDDFVSALMEDDEGSLWVGTRSGLSQLSDVKIPTLGKAEGLEASVNVGVFASRKGGVWVATSDGFTYFDGWGHPCGTNIGLRDGYIKEVFEASNGDLYLGNGSKDVEIYSHSNVVARYANMTWPTAMAEDSKGVVVAVGRELYRAGTNFYVPYTFINGQPPNLLWIFSMATARDGALWIACHGGLCRAKDGGYTFWQRGKEMPDSKTLWVCEDDDGIIWAGTETGLVRVKDGHIRVITEENGLFDNIINAIVPDDHGSLWIDSSRGFFSVSRKSLNAFADGRAERVRCVGYDGLDAIKSSEKYQQEPSGCKTLDGRIWFVTAQGIVMIDPTNLNSHPAAPRIHLHQVIANGRELDPRGSADVAPGDGSLEFQYAGLSFIAPAKIRYRYKLEGYEKAWVDAGARRAAFYTNLKPGKYRFLVEAGNEEGKWSEPGAAFEIRLRPHYYQAAWFYLGCVSLAGAGLAGIYSWRVRALRRKQKLLQETRDLLEARVAERTATLTGEVNERVRAQAALEHQKETLEKEIEERMRMEVEVERIHRQLLDASRQAGQAEVASSVLHNVGNVLTSVNISAALVSARLRKLEIGGLGKTAELMREHADDLGEFLRGENRGRKLSMYFDRLLGHLTKEREELLVEMKELAENIEHIKHIVAMQQSYAKVSGVLEKAELQELVEGALKIHADAFQRHRVHVVRDYETVPGIVVDRHKLLQILINIVQNAKSACAESSHESREVAVRIRSRSSDRVAVEIADNGVGIAAENLTRVFSHGFTTRRDGHGFGLHSSALAARQMGGNLSGRSEGLGKGATFTLELPLHQQAQEVGEGPDV